MIYDVHVASSWRNAHQPGVVAALRALGLKVYDFRNPPMGGGFSWRAISQHWEQWTTAEYVDALQHPLAQHGLGQDLAAMTLAPACVLVLPCGRSANAEAGWMAGAGKRVYVYTPEPQEPELMYGMFHGITDDLATISAWLLRDLRCGVTC